jgi:hypothetical protein
MSHNKGHSHNYKRGNQFKGPRRNKNDEGTQTAGESNPIVKAFREMSMELDEKHDRHERIVKISRDITIESKRIIFLLHSSDVK